MPPIIEVVKNNPTKGGIRISARYRATTSKIHDYRVQRIKDVPLFGKPTVIILKKRRYVCRHCSKKFYEYIDFLPRYHRMTNRLSIYILQQLKKQQSMKRDI